MKICILAPRFPFPEAGGDVLRLNCIAGYLKSKGHTVILVSFYDNTFDLVTENTHIYDKMYLVKREKIISLLNVMRSFPSKVPLQCAYFYSEDYLKKFKAVAENEKPDLYIAHTGRMVPYIEKCGLRKNSIIELTDALSKTYSLVNVSKSNTYKKFVYMIEKKRIKRLEDFVISKYKKVILISDSDKEFLGNKSCLYVYKMGISVNKSYPQNYKADKIVFVGNMRTLQNQDAVIYFAETIFPQLRKKKSDLKFYVIGAEPTAKIEKIADNKSIFVTGYVEDIGKEIEDACFAVAPVRIAAGVQNKVLMAMANHVPVILSDVISCGIPELISGKNCYIARKDEDYVEYCMRLLDNPGIRNSMADAGFQMIQNCYDKNRLLEGYEEMPDYLQKQDVR